MLAWYVASLAQAGYENEATQLAERLRATAGDAVASTGGLVPKSWLDFYSIRCPFKEDDDLEHFLDGLRKAGLF